MFGTALGDHGLDTAIAQRTSMSLGVVTAIGIDHTRSLQWVAAQSANRRNRVDQRQQLRDGVDVRTCQDRGERGAVGVGDDVVLGTVPLRRYCCRFFELNCLGCYHAAPFVRQCGNRVIEGFIAEFFNYSELKIIKFTAVSLNSSRWSVYRLLPVDPPHSDHKCSHHLSRSMCAGSLTVSIKIASDGHHADHRARVEGSGRHRPIQRRIPVDSGAPRANPPLHGVPIGDTVRPSRR